MFAGFEEKYVIREISSLMNIVSKIVTYRIDGELTDLQRRINDLANVLDIEIEIITINTWEDEWAWLKQS